MITVRLEGKHALAALNVLPMLKLFRVDTRDQLVGETESTPISREEAETAIKDGHGKRVFTPITGDILREMIGRIGQYQIAFDQTEAQMEKLEETVLADRAKFIRSAAAHLLASSFRNQNDLKAGGPLRKELSAAAVDWAQALDQEIWSRFEQEVDSG